ncbi:diguanylate cyclase (GGDEF) domain-containing protein [Hoeflea sp. IMCC20628]|nr:diguanylate cyclase (GGDEF) domain-containing protein [Hoeflea sp. IMCC20628]
MVFLPGISQEDAAALAQILRVGFSERAWGRYGIEHAVTVSFGVSAINDNERALKLAINRADQALYSAKAAGRNRVVVASAHLFPGAPFENFKSLSELPVRISA